MYSRAVLAVWAAFAAVAAAQTFGGPGSSAVVFSGRVQVLSKSFQGLPGTREVYLQSESPPPPGSGGSTPPPQQPPRRSAFKLEGTQAASLRSGQRVSITGRRLGGLGDGTERLVVTGVVTLEEPSYSSSGPGQAAKFTPPQPSSKAGAAGAGSGAGTGGRRLKQLQVQEPPVVVVGGGEAPPAGLPTSQLSLEAAEVSTLVLAISFSENCTRNTGGKFVKPWWSQQDVEAVIFGANDTSDDWDSVSGLFRSCSHGQSLLTRSNSRVLSVTLPCSGESSLATPFSASNCDYLDFLGWQEAAVDAARAQHGVDPSQYPYKHIIVPPGTSCPWVGLGFIGCDFTFDCASWIQGETLMGPTASSRSAAGAQGSFHEMGHNLFLDHSAIFNPDNSVTAYGDTSCAMGYCCASRCYNTPHAWQLGWLAPQVLDASSLRPATSVTVTFKAQSRGRDSGLQINATWAQPQNVTLYVSYRLAEGGDKQLDASFVNRVSVHNYTGTSNHSPLFSYRLGLLDQRQSMSEPASGLTIRVLATSPAAGTATVVVCRAAVGGREDLSTCTAKVDGDCDGLVGSEDPDCLPYLAQQSVSNPPSSISLAPPPAKGPPAQPANAVKACPLGHAFCTEVAKSAQQAKPKAIYFTRDSAGKIVSLCRYWLARPTCAGSLVPCGCNAAATAQGSAVKPPASAPRAAKQRCVPGHATCAARAPGGVCQYWAAAGGKQARCSGSGIPCSCTAVMRLRSKT